VVIGSSENTDIGDSATAIAGHVLTCAIDGMGNQNMTRAAIKTGGFLGRYIDIERRQIFRYPVPDIDDPATLRTVERRRVAINIVRKRVIRGDTAIPGCTGNDVPVEIDKDRIRCARTAVQIKGIIQRSSRCCFNVRSSS